ncbi:MAG TPA: ATP-binding protein [Kofleriaceae bacterium]|nr:ATP-binding protein [Kofleriaceae bacterium]
MKLVCVAVIAVLGGMTSRGTALADIASEARDPALRQAPREPHAGTPSGPAAPGDLPGGHLRFRALGAAEGLHTPIVGSIAQDGRGLLWIGTDDGVSRFDGERFTRFGLERGLPSTKVHVVGAAPDGAVCAGTSAGLSCWDGVQFSRERTRGVPPIPIHALASAEGRLWVGTADGLYVGDLRTGFARAQGWTGTTPVRALWADAQGIIAGDQGRVLAGAGDGVWRDLSDAGIGGGQIDGVLRDRSGAVWIRAAHHMWRRPAGAPRADDVSDGLPTAYDVGTTGTMVNGPHGEVWFAADDGIAYREGERWRLFDRSAGLPFAGARTLFVDREGSTWIGAVGLFQWRGRGLVERHDMSSGLPGQIAWSFARDREGVLWAGTDQCLARARDGRWACVPGSEKRAVRSFVFPPQGGVFLGGTPADLLYLDPAGKPVLVGHELDDLSDRAILALRIGPEGDLWIATRSGLFRLRGAVAGPIERVAIPTIPPDDCFSSLLVAEGRLWTASTHGLAMLDGDTWRVFGLADGFRSAAMRYVVATHDHGYCVAYTEAIGISCFVFDPGQGASARPRQLHHIGVAEGLGTGAVYFLGESRSHDLWIGTGDGVDVVTPAGIEHFSEADGLAGNDQAATAFFEDLDGSLWFGATGGASHFHAERYEGPPPPPRALVRTGKLGDLLLDRLEPGDLETPHDRSALKVELGSDRLADGDRVEYQARLLPLEPEWSATLARQARYPALLPGVYDLEIRARVGTGEWGPTMMLPFTVRSAWWQSRWFLGLMGVVALLAVGVGFTWRQRAVLQRRTRQLNEESAASVRALLELVPDMISVHRGGRVIYANLAARRILGVAPDAEVAGLGDRIHPDDQARVADIMKTASDPPGGDGASAMPRVAELRVRDEDGTWRICEVSGVWMELAGATVLVASGRDVTERHRLRAQLMVSDRMASLGTLAAGIAHEINNPLSYVLGNLQVIAESITSSVNPDDLAIAIGDATDGAQRVRKIVQGLRSFSRAAEETRARLDIPDVLRAAIRMTSNEVRHRAKLECEFGATPKVIADDGRLTQVFINLIVNAAHAIPEGRFDDNRITVRTRTDERGQAVVEIEDTGRGMTPEVQARAFDPFFTTKEVGGGTGLGLSICHGIINAIGGRIAIESTPGKGTKVRVELPAAGDLEIAVARTPSATSLPTRHRLRVMVVDDEPMVVDMLARVLRRDHDVVTVSCGRAALEHITGGARFDAIVSDVMMPNMTGIELLDALVELDREQAKRLIFLSGGVFTPETRARLDELGTLQLEKPVSPRELRTAVMGVATSGSTAISRAAITL